jgi:hypothetical protein
VPRVANNEQALQGKPDGEPAAPDVC